MTPYEQARADLANRRAADMADYLDTRLRMTRYEESTFARSLLLVSELHGMQDFEDRRESLQRADGHGDLGGALEVCLGRVADQWCVGRDVWNAAKMDHAMLAGARGFERFQPPLQAFDEVRREVEHPVAHQRVQTLRAQGVLRFIRRIH